MKEGFILVEKKRMRVSRSLAEQFYSPQVSYILRRQYCWFLQFFRQKFFFFKGLTNARRRFPGLHMIPKINKNHPSRP